jgi:hypothetical protein
VSILVLARVSVYPQSAMPSRCTTARTCLRSHCLPSSATKYTFGTASSRRVACFQLAPTLRHVRTGILSDSTTARPNRLFSAATNRRPKPRENCRKHVKRDFFRAAFYCSPHECQSTFRDAQLMFHSAGLRLRRSSGKPDSSKMGVIKTV